MTPASMTAQRIRGVRAGADQKVEHVLGMKSA